MESSVGTVAGRESEQEVLSAFVADSGGRALVLRGDTGVGKSALLGHVAELAAAEEHRVIRATGVEADTGTRATASGSFRLRPGATVE